jgi:hypothetical protein
MRRVTASLGEVLPGNRDPDRVPSCVLPKKEGDLSSLLADALPAPDSGRETGFGAARTAVARFFRLGQRG